MRDLDPPPIAEERDDSIEVLRVWAAPGEGTQVALRTVWEDPGAFGLLLVDIARHAANAYEAEGMTRQEVLARIQELFEAEWSNPTDEAERI
jgi:hypothetical protein